mmetsp:Transcript_9501/g.13976  ORF Transcript_9501/g.13976 Transcript_9501/m.13976 type:complete len:240 (-) Transcript_9501:70-789(-)
MKQLLDCSVRIRKNQTRHLIVLPILAPELHQRIDQILLLIRPVLHIRRFICTAVPDEGHDKGYSRDEHTDQYNFHDAALFGVVDVFHAPDCEVFVGGVEDCADESTEASDEHEVYVLPNCKVRCFARETVEFTKRKEFLHICCPPGIVQILQTEQGPECNHGTKEAPPRQLRTPVTRSFLQSEEDSTNGSTERASYSCCRSAGYKISLFAIVAKIRIPGKGCINTPQVCLPLTHSCSHH